VKLDAVDLDGVPGEWSTAPGGDASRVLMFFHGGGYCSGSILSHRRIAIEARRAGGVRALAVAYRLAPEHPFPLLATTRERRGGASEEGVTPRPTSPRQDLGGLGGRPFERACE